MSAWAIGGSTIDPSAPPDSITDSATPRRRFEPARDGAGVGHLRGAVADDPDDDEHRVEMPEVRRQQRQRREGAAEDRERRDDDPPRADAIEQQAERRRADGHGHRRDAEGGRDRLARPRELLGQRLEERAEGVDEQRGEADEHADAGGAGDTPPFVVQVALGTLAGRSSDSPCDLGACIRTTASARTASDAPARRRRCGRSSPS